MFDYTLVFQDGSPPRYIFLNTYETFETLSPETQFVLLFDKQSQY